MKRRTITFVINKSTEDAQIRAAADAAFESGDHLLCLLLESAPSLPTYFYGGFTYGGLVVPDDWSNVIATAKGELKERVDQIEQVLAKTGASGDVQPAMCVGVDIKHHVARSARVSDEVQFASSLRETPEFLREAAAGVLFLSPVGFLLNGSAGLKPQNVIVAWDSSKAAASAVHAALPYLLDAKEVVIACIDPVGTAEQGGQDPGADVAAWLSHHGCTVTLSQFPSGGRAVAACLQDRARDLGSDLVVMGAYGHARMIQTVFGGTTREMMDQTTLPVLFAH
jgi:nucleotide-binding universal stress UspA family protein